MKQYKEEQKMDELGYKDTDSYDTLCLDDTGYTDMFSNGLGDIMDEVIAGNVTIEYRGL